MSEASHRPLLVQTGPFENTAFESVLVGTNISIEAYLSFRVQKKELDDPSTDNDSADLDSGAVTHEGNPCSSTGVHWDNGLSETEAKPSKKNQNTRFYRKRKLKRAAENAAEGTELKQVVKKRRKESTNAPLSLGFGIKKDAEVKVTIPGWIGKHIKDQNRRKLTAAQLIRMGFTYFPWDGRTTHLLLDNEARVIGALVGQPKDEEGWKKVHMGVFEVLKKAASCMTFPAKEQEHRRGTFPTFAHGISFGGGQEMPRHLRHLPENEKILEELMSNKYVQRVCKFGSRAFETYSERNYKYMEETVEDLRDHYDKSEDNRLRRPYDSAVGVFPCRSLNLGKQSVSFPHHDEGNLVQSWCSITPFGEFDASNGGHLALWDFKLVVEFPAGSTVQIPSALICHSNTGIQEGETRYSMIQYAAGGLFRWVHNGFMSQDDWKAQAGVAELEQHKEEQGQRWDRAVEMFTRLDELKGKKN